jgi:methyl-accepting chemotaxis protein
VLAGLGTLALARFTARDTVESDLKDNANRLAEAVTDDSATGNTRRQLPLIRSVLRLQDAGLAVIPDASTGDSDLNASVLGELPPAVDLSLDQLRSLEPGDVVSGRDGDVVWAVAAAQGASNLVLIGLSREVQFELGPALRYFVFAATIVLLSSVVVARQLADRVTKPIREAERASRRLAGGDLTARLAEPDARTTDEVGDLTRSINAMAEALERSRGLERQFLLSVSHDLRTRTGRLPTPRAPPRSSSTSPAASNASSPTCSTSPNSTPTASRSIHDRSTPPKNSPSWQPGSRPTPPEQASNSGSRRRTRSRCGPIPTGSPR